MPFRPGVKMRYVVAITTITFFFLQCGIDAQLLMKDDPALRGIDISESLGAAIPLHLQFINEEGKNVRLSDVVGEGKPVVLTMAYYECPMLCTFVLNGLSKAVKELDWIPGEKYQLLTISIDANETPELARQKRERYVDSLGKGDIRGGWQFWVGRDAQIHALSDAIGFKYFYDEKRDEYAHPAVVFVITSEGLISRYLYGIEYSPRDLRLALLEASEGKIGSIIDRVLLYCYHYDPAGKKYAIVAMNVMRFGGALTLILMGLLLGSLWLKERNTKKLTCSSNSTREMNQ